MAFSVVTHGKPAPAQPSSPVVAAPKPPPASLPPDAEVQRMRRNAEQTAMQTLATLKDVAQAFATIERALAGVERFLVQSTPADARDLDRGFHERLGELAAQIDATEQNGQSWLDGPTISLVIGMPVPGTTQSLSLPDVVAPLLGEDGLDALDLGRAGNVGVARDKLSWLLTDVRATSTLVAAAHTQVASALSALGQKRKAGATAFAKHAPESAIARLRKDIVSAAGRALRAQANPSAQALALLEASR